MNNSNNIKAIAAVALGVALLVVLYIVLNLNDSEAVVVDTRQVFDESGQLVDRAPMEASGETIEYTFMCPDGDTFMTSYDFGANALTVIINEQNTYVLPQDISPDGARYATSDGLNVFVEQDGLARVEIGGETRYEECVVVPEEQTETPPAEV